MPISPSRIGLRTLIGSIPHQLLPNVLYRHLWTRRAGMGMSIRRGIIEQSAGKSMIARFSIWGDEDP